MSNDIKILEFITEYLGQIELLYSWLWERREEVHPQEIDEGNSLRDQTRQAYQLPYPDDQHTQ